MTLPVLGTEISIRTEPVSKALFQKFGQYYSG